MKAPNNPKNQNHIRLQTTRPNDSYRSVGRADYRLMTGNRGVTLVEIIVTVAILAIIAGVATRALSNFKKEKSLEQDFRTTLSLLDEARNATLASRDAAAWGVHFQTDKVVLYKTTYQGGATNNVEYVLSPGVTFSSIVIVGGGSDILFKRLTGATDTNGTTTLSLSSSSSTRVVVVSPSGITR